MPKITQSSDKKTEVIGGVEDWPLKVLTLEVTKNGEMSGRCKLTLLQDRNESGSINSSQTRPIVFENREEFLLFVSLLTTAHNNWKEMES